MLTALFKFFKSKYLKWWSACWERNRLSFSPQKWNCAGETSCQGVSQSWWCTPGPRMCVLCCLPEQEHTGRAPRGGGWQHPWGSPGHSGTVRTPTWTHGGRSLCASRDVTSTALPAVGPRTLTTVTASYNTRANKWTILTEWSSLNSPTQLLHTLECCCFPLCLFMNKLISKSTTIKDINSTIIKAYLVIFSTILAKRKRVGVLVFPCWISAAKNATKFSRTQNVYLLCHIKLQIICAFKKK